MPSSGGGGPATRRGDAGRAAGRMPPGLRGGTEWVGLAVRLLPPWRSTPARLNAVAINCGYCCRRSPEGVGRRGDQPARPLAVDGHLPQFRERLAVVGDLRVGVVLEE